MKRLLLEAKLYDFQEDAVDFAIRRKYSICAMDMGLGKSLVAIAAAVRTNSKALIICPAFLKMNWEQEINKFTTTLIDNRLTTSLDDKGFTITSYSSAKKLGFKKFDMIICDEAHYLKNPQAARTKHVHELIALTKPEYLLLLTGTPIKNRVPEFWSLLQAISYGGWYHEFNHYYSNYYKFAAHFSNMVAKRIGGRLIRTYEGMRNTGSLRKLIKPVYFRKRSSEALDLPEQIRVTIRSGASSYEKDLESAWERYESGGDSTGFSTTKAVNALAKVDFTAKYVKDLKEQGIKCVVFTDHRQSASALKELLVTPYCVTGETPVDKRVGVARQFNDSSNPSPLIATIGSLSTGVTLTGSYNMVFNDSSWVPGDMDQAEKRIHRIGQKRKCVYHYIMSGPIDERIHKTLMAKRKVIQEVT